MCVYVCACVCMASAWPSPTLSGVCTGHHGFMQRLLADSALADQLAVVRRFLGEPALLTAVCIYWVERIGSGLGAAVVPFFALALGLKATEMGIIQSVALLCLVIPAPLYGWIQVGASVHPA